jgi:hypothetical protein
LTVACKPQEYEIQFEFDRRRMDHLSCVLLLLALGIASADVVRDVIHVPSKDPIPSARKCYLCARNELSPM